MQNRRVGTDVSSVCVTCKPPTPREEMLSWVVRTSQWLAGLPLLGLLVASLASVFEIPRSPQARRVDLPRWAGFSLPSSLPQALSLAPQAA